MNTQHPIWRCFSTAGIGWLILLAGSSWGQKAPEADAQLAVQQLAETLRSGDLQERREAAWTLAEFGPAAAPAVPALAVAASDRDPQVGNGALQALGRIGRTAEAAIPEIFAQLRNGDTQRRYRAAFAMGRAATADNPLFLEGLQDRSANLRAATADAVGWIDNPPESLVDEVGRLLTDENQEVLGAATAALQRLGPAAVPTLSRYLAAPAATVQQRAAETLALIGPAGASASAQLIPLCRSDNPDLRTAAVTALGKTAADDPSVQTAIVAALEDPDQKVVAAAITAVVRFSHQATPALPQLIAQLDASPEVADLAAIALGRIGDAALPAIPEILQRMTPENQGAIFSTISQFGPAAVPAVLQATAEDLLSVGQAAEIVGRMGPRAATTLLPAVQSTRATDRAVAAESLGRIRREKETTGLLVQLLSDRSAAVRAAAAGGLAQLGTLAQSAQPRLRQVMQDADPAVRGQCLAALVALGAPADEITPALVIGLRDASPEVRRQAAAALGSLDTISDEAITALTAALTDDESLVRQRAAETLGRAPRTAEAAATALASNLQDSDDAVALAAVRALQSADRLPPSAVDALIDLLDHSAGALQSSAITALASGGEAARRAEEKLSEFRGDPAADIRVAALRTLAALADDDSQRLDVLMAGLEDTDWTVRRTIIEALGDMGDRATTAVPMLLQRMKDPQDGETAANALRRIDAAPVEALPMLVEILKDPESDRRHRYYAIHLLRKVGPAAQSALPVLREMRDQADGRLREFYDRAIGEIEPQ